MHNECLMPALAHKRATLKLRKSLEIKVGDAQRLMEIARYKMGLTWISKRYRSD